MFHHDQVEPSTSSSSTRRRAVFPPHLLQMLADRLHRLSETPKPAEFAKTDINLLSGERSAPNTSGIRLYNANRLPDQLWRDPQTGANPADGCRGRSDVRVCSKIDIQHQRVGTLDEDALPCLQSRMDIGDTVNDMWLQPRRQFLDRQVRLERK